MIFYLKYDIIFNIKREKKMNKDYFGFDDILKDIRVLKVGYNKSLRPFFDKPKLRIIVRRSWRNYVYSFDIYNWQKDFIWEYLNGYVDEDNIKIIQ